MIVCYCRLLHASLPCPIGIYQYLRHVYLREHRPSKRSPGHSDVPKKRFQVRFYPSQISQSNFPVKSHRPLTYFLAHLLTYFITHCLTHPLTSLLTHPFTYFLTHLLIPFLTHPLAYFLTHPLNTSSHLPSPTPPTHPLTFFLPPSHILPPTHPHT